MNGAWSTPPATIRLGHDEVHVWRASLDEPPSELDGFLDTLAADEQAKAARFHFQRDRERFITAHGVLREILGRYSNRAPRCLSFRYGAHGKPVLNWEPAGDALRFNMSHSRGVALYAIARDREVGVDLEFMRCDLEVEPIAERFFSALEIATLRALPQPARRSAFFLGWTRKEAYIKARGEGLSLPLHQFEVSLTPGEPAALLRTRPDSAEARRWSLRELTPAADYAAAVAVAGRDWSLSCWQWPGSLGGSL